MNTATSKVPSKPCPTKIEVMIEQLRQVEVFLGNIPNHSSWSSSFVKKISERAFQTHEQVFDEHKVNYLFKQIVKHLNEEGFSIEDTRKFINERLKGSGKLNYCSNDDIVEAINLKD